MVFFQPFALASKLRLLRKNNNRSRADGISIDRDINVAEIEGDGIVDVQQTESDVDGGTISDPP